MLIGKNSFVKSLIMANLKDVYGHLKETRHQVYPLLQLYLVSFSRTVCRKESEISRETKNGYGFRKKK